MNKLEQWVQLSSQLKVIKKEEMALRREICGAILEGMEFPAKREIDTGTQTVTAKNGVSHSVDEAVLHGLWNQLDSSEQAAIKWKPSLVMKGYKAIPLDSLLHEAVTTKPSAPTLKVEDNSE